MGIIGYYCFKFPDNTLSIVFLPFIMFKAITVSGVNLPLEFRSVSLVLGIHLGVFSFQGIKAMMAIDFSCLLMRFKVFDHAAHLGGALFGM